MQGSSCGTCSTPEPKAQFADHPEYVEGPEGTRDLSKRLRRVALPEGQQALTGIPSCPRDDYSRRTLCAASSHFLCTCSSQAFFSASLADAICDKSRFLT